MTNPGSQSTAVENNPSAERFGNEVWQRDTQNETEWIPGFGKMDPLARPDALNRYLKTPKITYEGIIMDVLYQQQQMQSQHEAQKKVAETGDRGYGEPCVYVQSISASSRGWMANEINQGGFDHRDKPKAPFCRSRHLDLVVLNAKAR